MTRRVCIIDTDPGTDDAIALWLALASPELDVRLVSVAGGNVGIGHTLRNARAIDLDPIRPHAPQPADLSFAQRNREIYVVAILARR